MENDNLHFEFLSDSMKFTVLSFNKEDLKDANDLIITYANNYSLENLIEMYEYCNNKNSIEGFIFYKQYELIFICSVLTKIMKIDIQRVDTSILNSLLPYLNRWWVQDGFFTSWLILTDIYNKRINQGQNNVHINDLHNNYNIDNNPAKSIDTVDVINITDDNSSDTELGDFECIEATHSEDSLPPPINDSGSNAWHY